MPSRARIAALAVLIVLLASLATWWAVRSGRTERIDRAVAVAQGVRSTARARRAEAPPPPVGDATAVEADTSSADAPPPVDLEHADRDRDLDLHGIVVRPDGTPVAGAAVETSTAPWSDLASMNYDAFDDRVAGPGTTTSADGTFAVRLTRGDVVTLVVRTKGLRRAELPSRRAGERVRVVLDEGVTLRVRAHDDGGAPAAGVALRVSHEHAHDVRVRMDGVTDEDGRCAFAGLPPDVAVYVAGVPGGPHAVKAVRVALPASGACDVEVVAVPCRRLTGRVLDENGRVIAGAEVALREDFPQPALADADGRFALDAWSGAADAEVHARAPGFVRGAVLAGTGDVEIRLVAGVVARGRTVDTSGVPLAGALVSVVGATTGPERPWTLDGGHAVSAEDGTFTVLGVDPSMEHVIVAALVGYARVLRTIPRQDGRADLDLGDVVLGAPRTVAGTVLGRGDAPVVRAVVTLAPWVAAPNGRGMPPRGIGQREAATDDLGRFAFPDVGPGTYMLLVAPAGGAPQSSDVTVGADADPAPFVVRIPVRDTLDVRVTDATGAPVGGVWVMATAARGNPASVRTAANGTARVELPGAEATVRAIPDESIGRPLVAPPPRAVGPADAQVTIVLEEGRLVAGRVVGPGGKPVARAHLSVRQEGRAARLVVGGADGGFRAVVGVAGGVDVVFDGTVWIDGAGGGPVESDTGLVGSATGVAPGTEHVVVACGRRPGGGDVVVRALAPDGTPLANAVVLYGAKDTGVGGSVSTGADGTARIPDLAARTWTFSGGMSGTFSPPRYVDATPADGEVVLRWRASAVVAGTALLDTGLAPAAAEWKVANASGWYVTDTLQDGGAFWALVPAGDGPWKVTVTGRDATGEFEGVLDAVAAPAEGLRVRLTRK